MGTKVSQRNEDSQPVTGDATKGTICFIAQTASTCEFVSWQLNHFLGAYARIMVWCLEKDPQPPPGMTDADVFLATSHITQERAQEILGPSREVFIAERTVNIQNLGKLLQIESEQRVLVVASSEETARAAMEILINLGFGYLNMAPYYPGIEHRTLQPEEQVVTMGLSGLSPAGVTRVVDLGPRGIALSTFKRLLDLCRIPPRVLDDLTYYYVDALLHLCQRHQRAAAMNETLKSEMEVVVNTINEAIVAVNEQNRILLYNPQAERIFGLPMLDVLGKDAARVLPQLKLGANPPAGKSPSPEITKIGDKYFIATANPLPGAPGQTCGAVTTFRPVSEVQELDTKIRQQLKRKGHIARYSFDDITGESEELRRMILLARKFAGTGMTILLEGESGTGKEVLAQAIHNHSKYSTGPFVAINFAALTDTLADSELFGYIEGAFSGARTGGRKGLFEEAHKGTIFLDEIGDASLDVQKKILRVLEDGEVRRIGDNKITQVNVRVIAATNADLKAMVDRKKFRQDLFYRLYALPLSLPPLRSRGRDVLLLFQWFAQNLYSRHIEPEPSLVDFLTRYPWPGNIRELQNIVGYLSHLLEPGQTAAIEHLPAYVTRAEQPEKRQPAAKLPPPADFEVIRRELTEAYPLSLIADLLQEVRSATRIDKGLGRQTLFKRLARTAPDLTQYTVRSCMNTLERLGFLESGVTRQGSRITAGGKSFLQYLRSRSQPAPRY